MAIRFSISSLVMPSFLNLTASLSKPALVLKWLIAHGTHAMATVLVAFAVDIDFPSEARSFGTTEAVMVAAKSSSSLVLSRGGNKALSMGIRLTTSEMSENQFILLF